MKLGRTKAIGTLCLLLGFTAVFIWHFSNPTPTLTPPQILKTNPQEAKNTEMQSQRNTELQDQKNTEMTKPAGITTAHTSPLEQIKNALLPLMSNSKRNPTPTNMTTGQVNATRESTTGGIHGGVIGNLNPGVNGGIQGSVPGGINGPAQGAMRSLAEQKAEKNPEENTAANTGVKSPDGVTLQAAKRNGKVIQDGCFKNTYSHKKISSHADGEACLRHSNLISLNFGNSVENFGKINPSSICASVNGRVIQHTLAPGKGVQIKTVPGPGMDAKIIVLFCLGKSKLKEKCTPQKDEFMSALGADEDTKQGDTSHDVGWDGSKGNSAEDSAVEREVAAIDKEKEDADSQLVFTGWILDDSTPIDNSAHTKGRHSSAADQE